MSTIIVVLLVGAALYYWFILRPGNMGFWKLMARHPEAAEKFLRETPGWYIGEKPVGRDVVGPFVFVLPSTGLSTKLYCDHDKLEASQATFSAKFGNK